MARDTITEYMGWTVAQCEEHVEMLSKMIERMKKFAFVDEIKPNEFKGLMTAIKQSMEEKNNIENAMHGVDESEKERLMKDRELASLRYRVGIYERSYGKIAMDYDDVLSLGEEDDQG